MSESEVPVKKKYQSGSEKRKKRQEQQNKLNEQLKKTQNLFQLGFFRQSTENQPQESTSTFASHTMAVEPVVMSCDICEQSEQDPETATLTGMEVGAEEDQTEIEVQLQHQNETLLGLGVEYENGIGLWQNITEAVKDFWCSRDPNECQQFLLTLIQSLLGCDLLASARNYLCQG